MTEWDEMKQLEPERLHRLMRTPRLIDGRNCWAYADRPHGIEYEGIGRYNQTFTNNQIR